MRVATAETRREEEPGCDGELGEAAASFTLHREEVGPRVLKAAEEGWEKMVVRGQEARDTNRLLNSSTTPPHHSSRPLPDLSRQRSNRRLKLRARNRIFWSMHLCG